MKQKYIYLSLFILFTGLVSFVVLKYNHNREEEKIFAYALLPGHIKDSSEWMPAKRRVDRLLINLKANPDDHKSAIQLVTEYILQSRITGEQDYYDKASLNVLDQILSADRDNFEALSLKSLVLLSQHHFDEALTVATEAQKTNPYSAFSYGLLLDANVEMGNYPAAVDAAEKMISIKPDLRSYSRIAYLREIHGDLNGAIAAMKSAVKAGITGTESTEWCRIQLAKLYEQQGNIAEAKLQYQLSNAARPDYAYALTGLAGIAAFEKKYDSAENYYLLADKLIKDKGIKEELAGMYITSGNMNKAKPFLSSIIKQMEIITDAASKDPSAGHYSEKELAQAYLLSNNTSKALQHALNEYNRRPGNIEINQLVAWIYYKSNNKEKAIFHLNKALATNSKSPYILCTAALIYQDAGDIQRARKFMQEGMQQNPVLPYYMQTVVINAMKEI